MQQGRDAEEGVALYLSVGISSHPFDLRSTSSGKLAERSMEPPTYITDVMAFQSVLHVLLPHLYRSYSSFPSNLSSTGRHASVMRALRSMGRPLHRIVHKETCKDHTV